MDELNQHWFKEDLLLLFEYVGLVGGWSLVGVQEQQHIQMKKLVRGQKERKLDDSKQKVKQRLRVIVWEQLKNRVFPNQIVQRIQ